MSKKLSLLFAAAMLAFTFQAFAQEDDDVDMDDEAVVEQMDDNFDGPGPHRWSRHMGDRWDGPGRGPGMRGPGMRHPGGHWGPGMHMGMGRGMGPGMHMGMMARLDLTPDQERQMVDLMTENYRQRLLAGLEMRNEHKKLRDLYESANPNHDAIVAANQAIGGAKGKMDVLARKFQTDMKAILTPDQQKKWEEYGDMKRDFKRDRDGKDGKRRPQRGPGGPGPKMMDRQ